MNIQHLILLLLKLGIFGFIVYLIVTYIPMPQMIRTVIIGVAVIAILYWLVTHYGGNL